MAASNPTVNARLQQGNARRDTPTTIAAYTPQTVAAGIPAAPPIVMQELINAQREQQGLPPVAQTAAPAPEVAGILSGGLTNRTMAAQEMDAAQNVDPTAGMSPEQLAEYQRMQALNQRFGSDLSWTDPAFQYSPTLLGQSAGSQAAADPNAIAAQQYAMLQAGNLTNSNLQFQSPAQQNALMQQWAAVQGGQGAPQFMGNGTQQALMNSLLGVQAPQFMSGAQQQSALDRLNSVALPQFQGGGQQQALLNSATNFMNNTGPGSLQFDTSGRQAEQYGNLQGIIAGGGANAIEMAQRAAARADSESWLRGQREADMAEYAERGLGGSGMELLNLSADRQSAAQRNSMADLQTSAALEQRRMDAINAASGLATNMRGQTIDEQSLLNNRAMTGLSSATSLANAMRQGDYQEQAFLNSAARDQASQAAAIAGQMRGQTAQEQLGLNQALQSQFTNAAGIAGQMRGQDYAERTYGDQRMLDALLQQTNLSTTMRDQQANEQIANRNAQLNALNTLASTSTNARGQSAQESQFRANSADSFAQLNQSAINNAAMNNTNFLQNAYQSMINNRQQWEMNALNQGLNVAGGLMDFDARENVNASSQANNIGTQVANQYNGAQGAYNGAMTGMGMQQNASNAAAQNAYAQIYPMMGSVMGGTMDAVVSAGIGAAGQGAAGQAGQSGAAGAGINVAANQAGGQQGGGQTWQNFANRLFAS